MDTKPDQPHPTERARISVVMPCYNAAPFVREAVECVMKQTWDEVELIVVDDGSTDASQTILKTLADTHRGRIRLLHQDRRGPYPARNLGLRHASGGLVAFLDADDYLAPDCLEKLAAALEREGADIAYCGWQNVGEGAPGTEPYVPPDYASLDTAAEFLRACPWPIHAALVRREASDAVGGFSERCFSAMDYDFWLRLYAHTRKIVRVPEVMAFYRWHGGGQISKTRWKQVLDALRVRRDFIAAHPERVAHLPPARLAELCEGYLLREAYRAYWRRDLDDAQALFRVALREGAWNVRDLKYILPATLPATLFRRLVHLAGGGA
ncbi:glycosyltransferase [Thauera sp.]|uniref:glycosyltransferase family 2 protein n=1 Tax=Thauera sp. TaxID=1905334 RepID=UPI00262F7B60|nr:glycosyltransferase [Thauera sp.]MCK6409366.1 glycosyltransferase [Thauera sp.]